MIKWKNVYLFMYIFILHFYLVNIQKYKNTYKVNKSLGILKYMMSYVVENYNK